MIKRHGKSIVTIMVLISLLLTMTMYWNNQGAYAEDKPDATLYVHGEKANGGPIFNGTGNMGGGLWAPGVSSSGTMRIRNNYSDRIRVTNLGLSMTLEKLEGEEYKPVTDQELYELFAKNMELTIKRGRALVFSSTIYNQTFFEMLYQKNSTTYKGFDISQLNRFNIDRNDYVDLEYTVHMKEEAGNELQGLRATVAFLINVQQNPEPYTPPVYDIPQIPDDAVEDLVEEPIEIIPDIGGHWAHDCIETLIEKGIVTGYPDGTIRPENYITRAEAAVTVARALGIKPDKNSSSTYKDKLPSWAEGYIIALTKAEIFYGYTDKKFRPSNNITREEMTAVLIRAFDKKLEGDIELLFIDKDDIGAWAKGYVKAAVQNKVIVGYPNNTFKPQNNITRAESFTILCKLLEYHQEHDPRKQD